VRDAIRSAVEHETMSRAASMAFYAIGSLAPLTVFSFAVLGFFFEREDVREVAIREVEKVAGSDASAAFAEIASNARAPTIESVAAVLGLLVFLFGATSFFAQTQTALNRVWGVTAEDAPTKVGIWLLVRTRLLSLATVATVALLLLVSSLASGLFGGLADWLVGWTPFERYAALGADTFVSMATMTLLFAAIFRILPDVLITWRDVWFGAGVAAMLFAAGKLALGLYFGRSDIGSAYGAAGSFVVLLVWLYYSCTIFLIGAELCHAYAAHRGHRPVRKRSFVRADGDRHPSSAATPPSTGFTSSRS
jgi:membrane protein